MQLSMHQASAPVFARALKNTSALIDKAVAHCETKKIDPSVLVNYRLAPDMLPFKNQIYIMTDSAKGCVARLTGIEIPSFPDTESTLEELKARLAKTVEFVSGVDAEQIDGTEDKDILLELGPTNERVKMEFKGAQFLLGFVLPNFFFHATTAYSILRHCGVEIGKRDFLGGV